MFSQSSFRRACDQIPGSNASARREHPGRKRILTRCHYLPPGNTDKFESSGDRKESALSREDRGRISHVLEERKGPRRPAESSHTSLDDFALTAEGLIRQRMQPRACLAENRAKPVRHHDVAQTVATAPRKRRVHDNAKGWPAALGSQALKRSESNDCPSEIDKLRKPRREIKPRNIAIEKAIGTQ